ncbi:hypothetical protein [Leuconostoc citreum]|uniref:hypothetical protein n=1 Tax=Leuconostoc citreum TaxID=33964 RepID=UPI001887736A|nr:hypothetical protein [Leuconostoc citreum]MCQ6658151.1 hypothetical protein [Leuconostoc citreum]MCT3056176.1 hypothetical protein [Leuconostoc citreum]MCT3060002.1 hypothetical protein [Leuconostoc citreum]MCT3072198.1 hypothetical protein [Leuconostoc citreum]MCT3079093.1 hypothetical protein [Leuconostoc citreum]
MKQHRQETLSFWIYIAFIISVWCVYFVLTTIILLFFLKLSLALTVGLIVATVMTLLFVLVQRIFHSLSQ